MPDPRLLARLEYACEVRSATSAFFAACVIVELLKVADVWPVPGDPDIAPILRFGAVFGWACWCVGSARRAICQTYETTPGARR